jgi:hypothetical protein
MIKGVKNVTIYAYSMTKFFKKIKSTLAMRNVFLFLVLLLGIFGPFFSLIKQFDFQNGLSSAQEESPLKMAEDAKEKCFLENETGFEKRSECYANFYYKLALQKDTNTSFSSLLELQKIDDGARSCHFILHSIGRAAFDKDPENWKENLQKMPEECDYGGLHGMLEAYQTKGGIVDRDTIPSLCGEDTEGGCIHAVGHLVLIEEKNNLESALDQCGAFITQQDRHHCMAGAFMERMIPRNLVAHDLVDSEDINNWWDRIDEFGLLCRSYIGEQATACWTEISHAAVKRFNGNPKMIFDFCNMGPTNEAANSCRRHIIIEFVGISKFDLVGLKPICKLGPTYDPQFEEDCYVEIVKAAQSGFQTKDKLNDFCSSLESRFKKACYQSVSQSASRNFENI